MNMAVKKINISLIFLMMAAFLVVPLLSFAQNVSVPDYAIGGKCQGSETVEEAITRLQAEGQRGLEQYCSFELCRDSAKPLCDSGKASKCQIRAINTSHDCVGPTSCSVLNEGGAEKAQNAKINAFNKWREAQLKSSIAKSEASSAEAEVIEKTADISLAKERAQAARTENQNAGVRVASYQKKPPADRTPEETQAIKAFEANIAIAKEADAEAKAGEKLLTAAKKKLDTERKNQVNADKVAQKAEKDYEAAAKKVSSGKELSCITSGSCSGGWSACQPVIDSRGAAAQKSVGQQKSNRAAAALRGPEKRQIQVGNKMLTFVFSNGAPPAGCDFSASPTGNWSLACGDVVRNGFSKALQVAANRQVSQSVNPTGLTGRVGDVAGGAAKLGNAIQSAGKAASDYVQKLITGQLDATPSVTPSGAVDTGSRTQETGR